MIQKTKSLSYPKSMKLFSAFKFNVEILDEQYYEPEELLKEIVTAIYSHCEVRHVSVELREFSEDVISTVDCEFGEA